MDHNSRISVSMKKSALCPIIGITLALVTFSCQKITSENKQKYMVEFSELIREVNAKCPNMDEVTFEKLYNRYILLSREKFDKYQSQLTEEEIDLIGEYRLQFLLCSAQYNIKTQSKKLWHLLEDALSQSSEKTKPLLLLHPLMKKVIT